MLRSFFLYVGPRRIHNYLREFDELITTMPGSMSSPPSATITDDGNLELGQKSYNGKSSSSLPPQSCLQLQSRLALEPYPYRQANSTRPVQNQSISLHFRSLSVQIMESLSPRKSNSNKGIHINDRSSGSFEKVNFHTLPILQLCQQFNVSPELGLDAPAAARRLERDGKNIITQKKPKYFWRLINYIFGGFCSILWVGVVIFFICWQPLSDPPSPTNLALAILILMVIMLQASFSAFQDWSTSRVMNSILGLLPSECVVIRDGESNKMAAPELVVGDVVLLSVGNKVPADMRLIETSEDVRFDRAVLTGESEEIEGTVDATEENFLEARNMALMGTYVTNGQAKGLVVLTGGRTVMGHISKLTSDAIQSRTLIQQEILRFVYIIVFMTALLALAILFFWLGWLHPEHKPFMNVVAMLNNVMGCIVAFIPEGVPIAVALCLSLIARRMKSVDVLPKGLSTVETLGCVTVVCSDKTGTLTENKMSVMSIGFVDEEFTVNNFRNALIGGRGKASNIAHQQFHKALILCNGATFDSATGHLPIAEREINGDATDGAILRFVESVGSTAGVRIANEEIFQIPFNSKNKWMLTMYRESDEKYPENAVFVKGAPDILIPNCTSYLSADTGEIKSWDDTIRAKLVARQESWSRGGQRVIVICMRKYSPASFVGSNQFGDEVAHTCLTDLTAIGLIGIMDPPRPDTARTVADCRRAGARFFMVTGDFGLTAAAIARQVGIIGSANEPDSLSEVEARLKEGGSPAIITRDDRIHGSLVLEGKDIMQLTEDHWDILCQYEEIVFARTTPEQKLSIVNAFRERDNVVAVTGDGVNDAPALKAADVGIAIVTGSDVAIEAADLVLMGSFASIVDGIRLGRLVFQNLQKVIGYLLPAGSWSEVWPVLLNVYFGVPLPLSSFLMIIICCFTDLTSCLALIMEKEEFDLLTLPPRNHKQDHLINLKIYAQSYLFIGVMETFAAHAMFFFYMWKYARIPIGGLFFAFEKYADGYFGHTQAELVNFNNTGQCVYFITVVILQWGNLLSIRNKRLSILQADPIRPRRRNLWLFVGMIVAFIIAIFVTEVEGIQTLFGTASVPIEFWLIPLPLALGILMMDEIRKLFVRSYPSGPLAKIAW